MSSKPVRRLAGQLRQGPRLQLRMGTVDADNADGTIDVTMSDGTTIGDVVNVGGTVTVSGPVFLLQIGPDMLSLGSPAT